MVEMVESTNQTHFICNYHQEKNNIYLVKVTPAMNYPWIIFFIHSKSGNGLFNWVPW